jgi:hypothetical protein
VWPKRVPGGLGQIFITFGTWRWWGRHPHALAAFTPRNVPGTHFHLGLIRPQGHGAVGRKHVTEKSSDTTGNRSRDRPSRSATPGPLLILCAMVKDGVVFLSSIYHALCKGEISRLFAVTGFYWKFFKEKALWRPISSRHLLPTSFLFQFALVVCDYTVTVFSGSDTFTQRSKNNPGGAFAQPLLPWKKIKSYIQLLLQQNAHFYY